MTKPSAPARKYGAGSDGRFKAGNPGKPKGARHKTTILAEKLMAVDAGEVVKVVVDAAKNGDMAAARMVLDRVYPPRKDSPISFELPAIQSSADAVKANAAILKAVAAGDLTPSEADQIAKIVDAFVRTLEASEFEKRLQMLEQRWGK
jgi:hypothetical protein